MATDSRKRDIASAMPQTEMLENPKAGHHETWTVFEEISPAEEKKVLFKIDCVIMPLMSLVYFFQYLDKSSINYVAVFGLKKDLSLNGLEFSWVVSLFYFGQLVSEYPAIYLLSRLPLTVFVGGTIVAWGAVEMTLGATHNFEGIAAARFFLGLTEGCVSPAFIIITSNWYRRREHPVRVASWVSMNGISQMIGALIMYGVGHSDMELARWRAMFLVCGGGTVLCGLLFIVAMPRQTTNAWFLNDRERDIATRRLALDRATRDKSYFDRAQMMEGLKSPMSWFYVLMSLCISLTTPILKFSSQVINGFGFSPFRTMLVGLPGGAIGFVTVWMSALVPRIFPSSRIYTAIGLSFIPLIGSTLLLALPVEGYDWGVVAGTWFASCGSALIATSASLMASNVKGNTKKSTVSVMFFIAYCVGCIIGPQAWTEKDAPRYTKGCILSIASWVCMIFTMVAYMIAVRRKNLSRDSKAADGQVEFMIGGNTGDGHAVGVAVDSDLTDVQDKGFRY